MCLSLKCLMKGPRVEIGLNVAKVKKSAFREMLTLLDLIALEASCLYENESVDCPFIRTSIFEPKE